MVPDRKLRDGELRFEVRKIDKLWRVYDKVRGSFPYHNKDLGGKVAQDLPEKEAQVETERLNKKFVPEMRGIKKTNSKTVQAKKPKLEVPEITRPPAVEEETPWIDESEIPDYGVMDEETAKKYVEGIL